MRSMTGFGRGEALAGALRVEVEVASVNRRQLDVVPALPREAVWLEGEVRRAVAARASRGRVNVKVRVAPGTGSARHVRVDPALLDEYRQALAGLLGGEPPLGVADLLGLPGVIEVVEVEAEPEELEAAVVAALASALDAWDAMRAEEGAHLRIDLEERLRLIEGELAAIEGRAGLVPAAYRAQLAGRLEQAGLPVDLGDERIVREIALFAERCDTTEERVRLHSHLAKLRALLDAADSSGRPLDFLLQEIHREFNTIGSKANDALIVQHVVSAKTELEKLREQAQNIE